MLIADGVMGIAGCCISVDVLFTLDYDGQGYSCSKDNMVSGIIEIMAKETLTYYDIPRLYDQGIDLNCAELFFEKIPLKLDSKAVDLKDELISFLYTYLDRKDSMGFKIYQVYCKNHQGEKIGLNIDLSKSFVFFDDQSTSQK